MIFVFFLDHLQNSCDLRSLTSRYKKVSTKVQEFSSLTVLTADISMLILLLFEEEIEEEEEDPDKEYRFCFTLFCSSLVIIEDSQLMDRQVVAARRR